MMRTLFTLLIVCGNSWLYAQVQKLSAEEYILLYKDAAIHEMYRAHIPASITLAQGILESGCGNSRLAIEGNNHFGIKCKGNWTGDVIYENDDDSQECFRKYPNALASFEDHSNFLMKQTRYQFLFDYALWDYKSWAEGLKKAGYATNPAYPQLLIGYIEKYQLTQYDQALEPDSLKKELASVHQQAESMLFSINETQAYKAKTGDNLVSVALAFEMRIWQIKKYNDLADSADIHAGDTIYLKPKRNHGSVATCMVGPRDNLWKISQRYGIKLKKLREKNLLEEGQEPATGELIYLKEGRTIPPKLKTAAPKPKGTPVITDPIKLQPQMPVVSDSTCEQHVVQPGETLYRIAKQHEKTVEELQKWNHLINTNIYPGMVLWLCEKH